MNLRSPGHNFSRLANDSTDSPLYHPSNQQLQGTPATTSRLKRRVDCLVVGVFI